MILCFYKKEYCASLSIGCLIANLFSPMPVDILFGTLATVSAAIPMYLIGKNKSRNVFGKMIIASLFPTVANGIIVGIELNYFLDLPLILSMIQVAAGEFVCVSILGIAIFKTLEKNKSFMKLICFEN